MLGVRDLVCLPCVMAFSQVCQAIRRQLHGRRPSGKRRVKSAFQPGKKGGGEGSPEKRNRPRLSVGDTKHGSQRGPEEGEGGWPGHRSSPHLRGGGGKNVHCAFLGCGRRGRFSTSGLGEGLCREALRGQDKQRPGGAGR